MTEVEAATADRRRTYELEEQVAELSARLAERAERERSLNRELAHVLGQARAALEHIHTLEQETQQARAANQEAQAQLEEARAAVEEAHQVIAREVERRQVIRRQRDRARAQRDAARAALAEQPATLRGVARDKLARHPRVYGAARRLKGLVRR